MNEPEKIHCQSCGLPLAEGIYGTNVDGSFTAEYCKFCYSFGKFTEPELTAKDMTERFAEHLAESMGISGDKARERAHDLIPNLARWKES